MVIALGKAAIDRMIVPPLRMNVPAARALRAALDDALLLANATESGWRN